MTSEEKALDSAKWVSDVTEIYKEDLENYRSLAENLGCTVAEAMHLRMLGIMVAIAERVVDIHNRFMGDIQ